MEQTKKLTMAELKAKAVGIENVELLETIKGGDWSDCHGCPGFWAKTLDYIQKMNEGPTPILSR